MRFLCSAWVAVLTLCSSPCTVIADSIQPTEPQATICVGRNDPQTVSSWCASAATSYFDADCLSRSDTSLVLEVDVSADGTPTCKVAESKNATKADEFYCVQSVWEAAPSIPAWSLPFAGTKFRCTFDSSPRRKWRHFLNPIIPEHVAMHLIPAIVGSRLQWFTAEGRTAIDVPDNVVHIPVSKLSDSKIPEFRQEWLNYLQGNPHATKEQVIDKAAAMRQKYSSLFES